MIDRSLGNVKLKANARKFANFAVYLALVSSVSSAFARADDASYLPEVKNIHIGFAKSSEAVEPGAD